MVEGVASVEGLVEEHLAWVVGSMVADLVAEEVHLTEETLVEAGVLVEEDVSPKMLTLNTANSWVPITLQMALKSQVILLNLPALTSSAKKNHAPSSIMTIMNASMLHLIGCLMTSKPQYKTGS